MRKIIAGMFITLDGVVEAPEKWNPPYYDDELNQAVMPRIASAGAHLYGRRSYELFRGVFTGPAAPPHAPLMTNTLATLKEQPGGDITVGASGTLVRFLLRERLLDELQLLVHPVVADSGARLFEGYGDSLPLTLAHSRAHGNGVVALHYTPAA
jgi:riboflavin biosynthesis pyrimidine reductase